MTGKIQEGARRDISRAVLGQVPAWIDVGGAVSKRWVLSAYFSYGIGVMASDFIDECDAAARTVPDTEISCTASNMRMGATVAFHGRPTTKLDPWFGLSLGYEWLSIREHVESQGQEATVTGYADGLEFPSFEAGLDFRLSDLIAVGPFIAVTIGRYYHAGVKCEGACPALAVGSDSVDDTSLHVWSFIGVKGTLTP